jgi:hypothetical protein
MKKMLNQLKELQEANQSLQHELRQAQSRSQEPEAAEQVGRLAEQCAELQGKLGASEEQKQSAMEKLRKLEVHANRLETELASNRRAEGEAAAQARWESKFRSQESVYLNKYLPRGFPHDRNNASPDLDCIIFGGGSGTWPSRWETTSSFFATSALKAPKLEVNVEQGGFRHTHELDCPQLLGCSVTIPRVRRTRQVPWESPYCYPQARQADEATGGPLSARPPGGAHAFPSKPLGRAPRGRKTPSMSKASKLRQCMLTPSSTTSTPIRGIRSATPSSRNSTQSWTPPRYPRTSASPVPLLRPV